MIAVWRLAFDVCCGCRLLVVACCVVSGSWCVWAVVVRCAVLFVVVYCSLFVSSCVLLHVVVGC